MNSLKKFYSTIARSQAKYWILVFLFLELFSRNDGGVNPLARITTLQSLSDRGSFDISKYTDITCDWSQPPNGKIYSNKAPGPVLAAFPLFYVMERIPFLGPKMRTTRTVHVDHDPIPGTWYRTILSLIYQMLPFVFFTALLLEWLARQNVSWEARQFAALAIIFGNTAAIFMNTFFGHGFAAWLVLATIWAGLEKRYAWAGFFFGFAALSDYGAALLIFPLAWSFWPWRKEHIAFLLGGVLPGIMWIAYHTVLFGGPFALPQQFINPMFSEANPSRLWGIIGLPSMPILGELLFGPSRGILVSQPWVLLTFALAIRYSRELPKVLWLTCTVGLLGLLWMNASFNGWHGGGATGPRYLALIFPSFGILAALVYDRTGPWMRRIFWLSLVAAVALRALIYGGTIRLDAYPLWPTLFDLVFHNKFRPVFLFLIFVLTLGLAARQTWRSRPA